MYSISYFVVIIPLTHKAAHRKIQQLKIELLSNKLIDYCRVIIDSHRKNMYILYRSIY